MVGVDKLTPVMAGLVPAIPERMHSIRPHAGPTYAMRGGWVYIMTNRPNGTHYVGVASDIARRAWEHREGRAEGFTKRYGLKRLVLTEFYEDIRDAIQRESNIKHWPRAWKVRPILEANPEWRDLSQDLNN